MQQILLSPTCLPADQPTNLPTNQPADQPTCRLTCRPTNQLTHRPTNHFPPYYLDLFIFPRHLTFELTPNLLRCDDLFIFVLLCHWD
jgi:hypothetical protein